MEIKATLKKLTRYYQVKAWFEKYERILMPTTLILGVFQDWFTFTHINITTSFVILAVYLVLAGVVLLFLHAYDAKYVHLGRPALRYLRLISPFFIQFLFGALLSAVFIFYFFSGTFYVSWPFLLLLILLMVSNDVFHKQYMKALVQLSVYYFIVFSFFSVVLPFVLKSFSGGVFLFSGLLSLAVIAVYIALLFRLNPQLKYEKTTFAISIVTIFVLINGMYFFNLIPPIPLSMREAVVSHTIQRSSNIYILQVEEQSWWSKLSQGIVFHKVSGTGVSLYTAIFAPADLKTKIVHHWQWYNEVKKEWQDKDKLSFTIFGGRQEGFRGFSTKTNILTGKWRVDVKTEEGQTLGRVHFQVVDENLEADLKQVLK